MDPLVLDHWPADHKRCRGCGQVKPLGAFGRQVAGHLGRRSRCRECDAEEWAPGGQGRNRFLARRYGITGSDYDRLLADQGGVCAICREPERHRSREGRPRVLAVDHDHRTGAVRGLLCADCNNGLGDFRDRPELLRAAIAYLGT